MMNKKGAVPLLWWIIGSALALFVAHQSGLFAVFIPDVGQPSGTSSLVNPLYYGSVNPYTFPCQLVNSVVFRSTFPLTQTNVPSSSESFAIDEGSIDLTRLIGTSTISTSTGTSCTGKGTIVYVLSGKLEIVKESSTTYWVCQHTTGTTYRKFVPGTSTLSV